ncbi:MAG: PilZ domain-containing protein [Myxococcales bacterium]
MDDKRQFPRVKDPVVVVKVATVDKFRTFYLADLSAGGIFIRCERFLPLHSELDVKFFAPGLVEPLLLHGEVVRIEGGEPGAKAERVGMGIKFKNLAPASVDALASLIAEHTAAPQQPSQAPGAPAEAMLSELATVKNDLRSRGQELADLQGRLAEAQALMNEYGRECDQLKADREVLKSQLDAASQAGSSARSQGEGERAALQDELDRARAENAELQARAAELAGQLDAFRAEYQTMETDEAATRALAERLAREKAALEKKRKDEAQALAAEAAQLREQLAQARAESEAGGALVQDLQRKAEQAVEQLGHAQAQLEQERAEHAHLAAQLVTSQEEVARVKDELGRVRASAREAAELRLALSTEHSRSASLERMLADSKTQLERVRQKERELRRLVALVSSPQDEEVIIVNEGAETPPPAELSAGLAATEPPAPAAPTPAFAAEDAASGTDDPVAEEPAAEPPAPPAPAAPASSASPAPSAASLFFDELPAMPPMPSMADQTESDLEIAVDDESPLDFGEVGSSQAGDAVQWLREGRGLHLTPAFEDYKVESGPESQVAAWLRAASDFPSLAALSRGAVDEEGLLAICVKFLQLGLVEFDAG